MPNDAVQDETDIINDFDLQAPSAINPTSEALFYRHFSTLIKIHTNLPLMLYHWLHAIQLECSNPNPLISQGFLCQEGHTTFATKEEAKTEVLAIIEPYRCLCKDYLVVPVLIGTKSEMEKFANGLYTASVEAFIPSTGRGVQAAIAHYLGQSLANWYHINFEDNNGETAMVWHNSWAFTTRMIRVMVMVMPHGDDKSIHIEGTKLCERSFYNLEK